MLSLDAKILMRKISQASKPRGEKRNGVLLSFTVVDVLSLLEPVPPFLKESQKEFARGLLLELSRAGKLVIVSLDALLVRAIVE